MENLFELSVKRFNEFAQEYAEKFMSVDSYRKQLQIFCDNVTDELPVILDVACGPGNVTKYIQNELPHSQITGIDLAPAMISIAKKEVPQAKFICMNALNIHELKTQFNGIMCSFCFPFFSQENVCEFIQKAFDKLSENGILYISTMEGDSEMASLQSTSFSGNSNVFFNYHLRNDLRNIIEKTGFTIIDFSEQDYNEPDGSISTDLIFVAKK